MKYLKYALLQMIVLTVLISPLALSAAESNLIFCNTGTPNAQGEFSDPCGWREFVNLGQRFINYLILLIIPLATVTFAWAGFTILTAGGNAGQVQKGKEMFSKVAIGIAWALAAWLVINTILNALVGDGYSLLGTSS